MNWKQEELVRELEQELLKRFPNVTIEGYQEIDGAVMIAVSTPEDNAWEIAEATAPLSVEILERTGYLIGVAPGTPWEMLAELEGRTLP